MRPGDKAHIPCLSCGSSISPHCWMNGNAKETRRTSSPGIAKATESPGDSVRRLAGSANLGCRRARKAFAAESTIVNVWRFAKSAIRNPKSLLDSGRCRGRTRRCRCRCERHRRPTRSSPGNPLVDAVREAVIEIRLEAQRSRFHVPRAILELSETTPRVEEEQQICAPRQGLLDLLGPLPGRIRLLQYCTRKSTP